jgi:hypothetical protein
MRKLGLERFCSGSHSRSVAGQAWHPFVLEFRFWCQMSSRRQQGPEAWEESRWACSGQPGELTVGVQTRPQQAPGSLLSPCVHASQRRELSGITVEGMSLAPWPG